MITDSVPAFGTLPKSLRRDIRSDHAGETGAVYIYRGILAVSRNPEIVAFARDHLATEEQHLAFFEEWMPRSAHSVLIPLWRLSGWMLGALGCVGGPRGVFATIEAVETFVVTHYRDQLEYIDGRPDSSDLQGLRAALEKFMTDEDHHRDDAARRKVRSNGVIARSWAAIVGTGSAWAVVAARRV